MGFILFQRDRSTTNQKTTFITWFEAFNLSLENTPVIDSFHQQFYQMLPHWRLGFRELPPTHHFRLVKCHSLPKSNYNRNLWRVHNIISLPFLANDVKNANDIMVVWLYGGVANDISLSYMDLWQM